MVEPEANNTENINNMVKTRVRRNRRDMYNLHIELERDYEPLSKRNKTTTLSAISKEMFRMQGKKNLDLWIDGRLYPKDPFRNSTPPFKDITSLINFVGDGHNGLLGYTQTLEASSSALKLERDLFERENIILKTVTEQSMQKILSDKETIISLEKQRDDLRLKQTALGLRKREKKLQSYEQLKIGGGGIKKRIHAIRSLLNPDKESQSMTEPSAKHLSVLLNCQTVEALMDNKKYKKVAEKKVEHFIKENQLNPRDIQAILDEASISHRGYSTIYKSVQSKMKQASIKTSLLPNPTSVKRVHKQVNEEVLQALGNPFHIEATYTRPSGDVIFNKYNNIFYSLEALQIYVVQLFEITHQECNGVLKFVLKLDECQIVKERKLERVTITLMNRALDPTITKGHPKWFSVQSENNIFSLGSFEVPSENFDILHWVFHMTPIAEIISEQRNGRKLDVEDMGEYEVEWHLAGDLKTLKCMYNVSMGANSPSPCLYCINSAETLEDKYWKKAPNRHLHDLTFKPVLDIPLSRVHICTMHALCRIIEKIMFLYICFAWTLQPNEAKIQSIKALENVLSDIGLHGGHVHIEADEKRSTDGRDVPKKLSIGGVKARRFLSMPDNSHREGARSSVKFNRWKCLHNAVVDHADNGLARSRKADVWKALDTVFKYCDKKVWNRNDHEVFKQSLELFKKSMLEAWTSEHITHYMHIIYNHTPWFAKKYGSLSIWSTQGMEKTHYQARTGYFKHTRHGGGVEKANSLEELHQWTYRKLVHRAHRKKELQESEVPRAIKKANRENRKDRWWNSNANVKHAEWRQMKQRCGKTWIPLELSSSDT